MNIVFLCDILEPSRSGVGDYTRWLAKACADYGHSCSLIAFKDPFLKEDSLLEETQNNLPTTRFKNAWESKQTIQALNHAIESHNPDWISLQFVPYSFHPKGLIYNLSKNWKCISTHARLHIMFHEIWIGFEGKQAPSKSRFYGWIQKYFLRQFLTHTHPQCLHTHAPIYQKHLSDIGFPPKILSLFSNIIPTEENADSWLFSQLNTANIPITSNTRKDFWLFGLFGTLHPNWPPEPLTRYLEEAAIKNNKKIVILSIGHIGPGQNLWDDWSAQNNPHIQWVQTGSLSNEKIAMVFQSLDFGIAASPHSLIAKSCSAISMLENGIPVIVNRLESIDENTQHPLLIKMSQNLPEDLANATKSKPHWTLQTVAKQFLNDLSQCQ